MGSAFTGTNTLTLFTSPSLVKPSASPAAYPLQSINIANLCPGTVYQFRAREQYGTATFSGWTSTYTFTTPGTFVPPTVNIAASSNTICPPQTSTLNATVSNTCGLSAPSYSWLPSTGLSCTTCSNPIASPAVSTNYTCIVSGGLLGCWTATSVVSINISSGSAILNTSATQANCSNSVSTATLSPSGSASVQTSVTWSPSPASVSGNSLVATGLPVGITTITVFDGSGCKATTTLNILPAPPPVTFTVNNATGSQSITCLTPTINMNTTTNYTYGTISYTWTNVSFTATGNNVALTNQGSYNVCGMDAATQCSLCQTFTIGQNITPPTTSVNPVSQVVTCSLSGTATFSSTAMTPTNNIVHNWYTPLAPPPGPPSASSNNQVSPYVASSGPGTYSVIVTDLVNGCSTTKTVAVTSISGFPTFSTTSTTNYSVGCSPTHNTTTLSIVNAVSANSAAVQFAFLPPTFTGTTITFGATSSTVTTVPGTWTFVVNDPSNSCQTALPIIILQNTIAPHVLANMITQTLTCTNPTVLATGTSTTPNTQVVWNMPSTPPTSSTPTIVIGPGTGPNTSTTSLTYASYTVAATNTVNGCKTNSVVVINQNFRIPLPLISVGNPSVINCNGICPNLSFTNAAVTSSVPGAFAIVTAWEGPAPQTSVASVAQYTACVAGVYTLTVKDSYNGCLGSKTFTVLDKTQPPVMSNVTTATLDCAANKANLSPIVVGGNTGHIFYFEGYPHGTSFTPSTAIIPPGTTSGTIGVDMVGTYTYIVTNTVTGCSTTATFDVGGGDLVADFTPDPSNGFSPMAVNFTNNSASSLGSGSITSVWSFGNGTTQTTTTNINTNALYTAPGTYTVMLIAMKGACLDTAFKVIKVEAPSKLEAPNVFTPNGDGSNDVFFLKTQNLTEINCIIFDRWGNKVYEVISTTGNIAWDGKNFEGKECAAGVYFYLLKATGKDSKTYDQKGNVSLFR